MFLSIMTVRLMGGATREPTRDRPDGEAYKDRDGLPFYVGSGGIFAVVDELQTWDRR